MTVRKLWYPKFVSKRRANTELQVIEFMSKKPKKIWQVAMLEREMLKTLEPEELDRMLVCIPQVLATMENTKDNPPARWNGVRVLRVERGRYKLDFLAQPKLTNLDAQAGTVGRTPNLDAPVGARLGSLKKCPMAMQMSCKDCRLYTEYLYDLSEGPVMGCIFESQRKLQSLILITLRELLDVWAPR